MKAAALPQLLEALYKTKKIDPNQLSDILLERKLSGVSLEQLLEKKGILKPADAPALLEGYFKVPFISIDENKVDKELLKSFPEEVVNKYRVLPVEISGNEVKLAMVFPNDLISIDDIQILTGFVIKPFVALESNVEVVLSKYYSDENMGKALKEVITDKLEVPQKDGDLGTEEIREFANKAPVVKLVDAILIEAVKSRASDIHIEPQEHGVFVRYRVNGMLFSKEFIPKEIQLAVASRIKIMAAMNITERRMPQDGQISLSVNKRNVDFRVSTLPAKYGEKIVIRVLDKSSFALGIEHLGFQPETQTKFEELLNLHSGIILVTGPTGSGKTTTLYSALNKIKSSSKNIITLEDPIEYDLLAGKARESGITQVQINSKIGFTFAQALRACLRQDPNVILVGEIRDEETCRIAINAALMGHLVLSTIHTNDSVSTVTRLLDMGVEPYLIASSLHGVLAQRLVRALCTHCRDPYKPPARVLESLKVRLPDNKSDIVFYRPRGCAHCDGSGYSGRVGIYELLVINEAIRDMILSGAKLSDLRAAAEKNGMVSMKQNGITLVSQGVTTMAEVLRVLPAY
ncbi:MAG TPA: type II secretion system protein GspE [Elusimicrobia bacterium]|nr:MAG: hypothetical protein A2278_07165 [Elusimicrobia bacterium RIFOXYA12_FULL_49_49]OGS05984.1 MAG: hypothetical protein A2204_02890 [Elusimicrobia bacterium RIFOXYA1_FULL_47_7]OGS16183.1 MAG: hypothetical protein A2251_01020 [Elusimicrobia bacterium RIFOXYA2_FULL_47_53]OGS26618.1 MAG: hypothetical protein A2339_04340 [Elusimicrobia bacterium RIFOXYB12_FULL_50_12]OGS31337.1 MAG: hypothetical protein A2323_09310 [Elusimicrobia bacterium RIFOXYB2_FULL_46_23]HBU69560.1 type II secretion system